MSESEFVALAQTKVLRMPVSDSRIFRITNQVGGQCEVGLPEAHLQEASGQGERYASKMPAQMRIADGLRR